MSSMARRPWIPGLALAVGAALLGVIRLAEHRAPALNPSVQFEDETPDAPVDAGPRVAATMVDRVQLFSTGNADDRMTLDGPELTALLRHAASGLLPSGITAPRVRIMGSEVHLDARASRDALSASADLGSVLGVLPDTLDVTLRGRVIRNGPGGVAFQIDHARVSHISLPRGVIAAIVAELPGGLAQGVPARQTSDMARGVPAIQLPWPNGITSVLVRDGLLVLERAEPILDRAVDGSGSP